MDGSAWEHGNDLTRAAEVYRETQRLQQGRMAQDIDQPSNGVLLTSANRVGEVLQVLGCKPTPDAPQRRVLQVRSVDRWCILAFDVDKRKRERR